MKRALIFTVLFSIVIPLKACLICIIQDENKVLVGNHEDWYAKDSQVTFRPQGERNNKYGMVFFGFASEGGAQGGMNTEGLFFDGTISPYVPIDQSDKIIFDGYLYEEILGNAASIEEVVVYLKKYEVTGIEEVHLMFADRTGSYVIVNAYEGKLNFHYKDSPFKVLTNFNINNPHYGNEPTCMRFTLANSILEEEGEATVENVKNVLENTTQEALTVYSNIYDLTEGEVYVYWERNFDIEIKINLSEELQLGSRSILLEDLVKNTIQSLKK